MTYVKRIVCLANSRKMSGRCLAGKVALPAGWGQWIRPVSGRASEELSEEERRYADGRDPRVGDVIAIPLREARPHAYQQENHLIDERDHWTWVRTVQWLELVAAVDAVTGPLWQNGHSSYNGQNDRVPVDIANGLKASLYLIRPSDVAAVVSPEWERRRRVRVEFTLAGAPYRLAVTDPLAEREYLQKQDGSYGVPEALLCVSLGEPYEGHAYKLVAAIITPEGLGR